MTDDERWRAITVCAMIAEVRGIADPTDTLLAAYLSMAEHRATVLRDGLFAARQPGPTDARAGTRNPSATRSATAMPLMRDPSQ